MALIGMLLTVGISLSGGCGSLSNAERIEAMKESSVRLVQKASESFDYSGFSLDEAEQKSFVQQKLYSFALENGLYSEESLASLQNTIFFDPSYTDFSDSFFRPDVLIPAVNASILAECVHWFSDVGSFSFESTTSSKSKPINKDESFKDYDGSGGGASLLDKIDFDKSKMTISLAAMLETRPFFGLYASSEMCAGIYEFFANFINHQILYNYSGSGSTTSLVVRIFSKFGA